jgi:hypothetical protein
MDSVLAVPGQLGDRPPEPLDRSICLDCGALLIYDDDLQLREPTEEESVELMEDPIIKQAIAYVKARGRFHGTELPKGPHDR